MSRKQWVLAEYNKELAASISDGCNIDPFVSLILTARGCKSIAEAEAFFCNETDIESPFALKDMDKAVACINRAVDSFKRICIFGDYDADGVTSTAMLYSYLEAQGGNVSCYIPSRIDEGYGLCAEAIEKLAEDGTELIITVDNGISAHDAAKRAKELGIELVITDHHRPGATLPDAVAVVDPHREDDGSAFKNLAGVGVALKLAAALENGDYDAILDDYADIITIGTIADIVPLVGENRILVQRGMEMINNPSRCGIVALTEVSGLADKDINSANIAYMLAPRINAAGRMGSADSALKLLLAEEYDDALIYAEEINKLNIERHAAEAEIIERVEADLAANPLRKLDRILVIDGENWHQGVIGIVASRLVEHYGRPAVVISRCDDGTAKGSARSIDGFSLFDALSSLSSMLIHFGGHTIAAGFSIENGKIDGFRKAINEYAAMGEYIIPKLKLDLKLHPSVINLDMVDSLIAMEPFGAGNPQPFFGLYSLELKSVKSIGNGKHIVISLTRGDTYINAVKFGTPIDEFDYVPGDLLDLAVRLERNEYRGEANVSIQVKEIRLSGSDDAAIIKGMLLYEKIMRGEELSADELLFACPDRRLVSNVYRYIKERGTWSGSVEVLARRAGLKCTDICRVMISLEALCGLNILNIDENGAYNAPVITKKVDLASSDILQKLGYNATAD